MLNLWTHCVLSPEKSRERVAPNLGTVIPLEILTIWVNLTRALFRNITVVVCHKIPDIPDFRMLRDWHKLTSKLTLILVQQSSTTYIGTFIDVGYNIGTFIVLYFSTAIINHKIVLFFFAIHKLVHLKAGGGSHLLRHRSSSSWRTSFAATSSARRLKKSWRSKMLHNLLGQGPIIIYHLNVLQDVRYPIPYRYIYIDHEWVGQIGSLWAVHHSPTTHWQIHKATWKSGGRSIT